MLAIEVLWQSYSNRDESGQRR